jgi:hypothetical protein
VEGDDSGQRGAQRLDRGAEGLGGVLGQDDGDLEEARGFGELDEIERDRIAPGHFDMKALLDVDQDEDGLVAAEQLRVHQ